MDKKRLQKVIDELSAIADGETPEICETAAGDGLIAEPSADGNGEPAAAAAATAGGEVRSINESGLYSKVVSYPNDYFTITDQNGMPFDQGFGIGIATDEYFIVSVNYDNVLRDFGERSVLRFFGVTKMVHSQYTIYSTVNDLAVGTYRCMYENGSYYELQLDDVYEKGNGSADFKFVANWDGTETLILDMCEIYSGISPACHNVSGITVVKEPDKKVYVVGERFDPTGMEVEITYDNNLTYKLPAFKYSPTMMGATDDKITVRYHTCTCEQPITVITPTKIEITKLPDRMSYYSGDSFDNKGMVVTCTYSNGEEREVGGYVLLNTELTLNAKTVTVSYMGLQTSLTVNVAGQRISPQATVYQSTNGVSWTNGVADSIYVCSSTNIRLKTTVNIPVSSIDFGGLESAHLKMKLTALHNRAASAQFYINDNICYKQPAINSVMVDLGVVNASDKKEVLTLEFKCYIDECQFGLFGENAPVLYLQRVTGAEELRTLKEFTLVDGVSANVDLFTGRAEYTVYDIPPQKALLGFGIGHIGAKFNYTSHYGNRYRLNLEEKLTYRHVEAVNGDKTEKHALSYTYIDVKGNVHNEKRRLFYVSANESGKPVKTYLEESDYDKVSEKDLTFNGKQLYSEFKPVLGQYFLNEPTDAVKNSSFYKNATKKPVCWLKCGNLTKSFDDSGKLVMVNDEFGNYFTVAYNTDGSVDTVTDCNGGTIQFSYTNGLLSEIVDARGRTTTYTYDKEGFFISNPLYEKGTLREINAAGRTLTFAYDFGEDNRIKSVTSSDGLKATIDYDVKNYGAVKCIKYLSTKSKVPDGETAETEISRFDFDYSDIYDTHISDGYNKRLIYRFKPDGELDEFYEETAGYVTAAERYFYTPYSSRTVVKAAQNTLNKTGYKNGFYFYEGEKTVTQLDNYNRPTSRRITCTKFFDDTYDEIKTDYNTEYKYDDFGVLTEERTTEQTYKNGSNYTLTYRSTIYTYDAKTSMLIRKANHATTYAQYCGVVKSEDSLSEEYVYDAKGNLIKTLQYTNVGNAESATAEYCSCTSANSDTVFYTEYGYDDERRLISTKDATGLYETTYEYAPYTELVKTVTPPDGCQYAYTYDGRDRVNKYYATVSGSEHNITTGYDLNEVTKLTQNGGTEIKYEYDGKRRVSKVYLNGSEYESYAYEDGALDDDGQADKVSITNAKNETFTGVSYRDGVTSKILYNDSVILSESYDRSTRKQTVTDSLNNETQCTKYDAYGNITEYTKSIGSATYKEIYTYGVLGWIESVVSSGTVNRTTTYGYEDGSVSGRVIKQTLSPYEMQYKYDGAGRLTEVKTFINGTEVNKTTTEYYKAGDHATNMPFIVKHTDVNGNYKLYACTYDKRGNITTLENNGEHRYWYDDLNRLVRETWTGGVKDITYSYDKDGNITSKTEERYDGEETERVTHTYSYSGDRLTYYDGEYCSYDAMGNPIIYRGQFASWVYGRRLSALGDTTFKYNAKGQRTKKNSIEYYYDSQGRLIKQSNGFEFFYDITGVIGFKYINDYYVYRKDAQGNIIAIVAADGTVRVTYDYDAWGNHIIGGASMFGEANPFRYRGYYYDQETGLYYLQTRYYDPETGRFLNMDSIDYADPESLNGLNLYAYCNNNPVMYVDETGEFVSTIIGAIFGAIWGGVSAALQGKNVLNGILVGAGTGAAAGFFVDLGVATMGGSVAATIGGLAIASVGGFAAGFVGDIAAQVLVDGKSIGDVDMQHALVIGGISSLTNIIGAGISAATSGLGDAIPKTLNVFNKMLVSLNPKFTPLGSWIGQLILGFGISSFPNLPWFRN